MEQKRILLAEDYWEVAHFIENTLGNEGYIVDRVTDGTAAWERLQTGNYDMLICDVRLPVINGWELISKVRSAPSLHHTPAIIIMNNFLPGEGGFGSSREMGLGADMYLYRNELMGVGQYVRRIFASIASDAGQTPESAK